MKRSWTLPLYASLMLLSTYASAEENYILDTALIEDEVISEDSTIGSKSVTTSSDIKIFDSAELINPYKAISLEPGVDIRFNDPFGMNITHKIRGKSNRNIGETLEGLPLKGIGPGGGLSTMVDIENIDYITVEKGAIKADSGFGYGSDDGMVDMHMKHPADKMGTAIKQSIGSDSFSKTYMRVDSGDISDTAKFFISGSTTNADKWKGEGEGVNRKNLEFGVSGTSKQHVKWELYGIYNDQKQHNYKGLTYAQSKDLSNYRDLDYQTTDPSKSDYYDYNKQDFQTYAILGKLEIPLTSKDTILLRPYFLNDKGYSYSTSGTNVMDWLVDHDTYGNVAEYIRVIDDGKFKIGYWYQEDEPPGPPTSRKVRKAGSLDFIKWERIIGVAKNHTFSAPYLTIEKAFGNTFVEAGLKYLWQTSPTLSSYSTNGINDTSYEEALSMVTAKDFTLHSNRYEIFLPSIGATHYINDSSSIKASYGRNYNVPNYSFGGNMINYFNGPVVNKNEATLQKMWDDLKPEESDNFDIGYSYKTEKWGFNSTLFYSFVKNVGGVFYDPILNYNYQQNTAEAESYGLEIGANYKISSNFTINAAATYNRYAFTTDIQSASSAYIQAKGHQHPDVPKFFGNISAEYDLNGYKIAPILRYVGKRYVDTLGQYSVNPYYLVDLSINKEIALDNGHSLDLSLSATNLMDKKYISTFSASEINIVPETTYTVGSPRAVFASVQYRF